MMTPRDPSFEDHSPIPPTKHIPKPNFPIRAGVKAAGTAILIFVSLFCIFQYWLLTATLEAYHAGDNDLPLGAFLASVGCFILATGLAVMGEIALIKQQDYLAMNQGGKLKSGAPDLALVPPRSQPHGDAAP